MTTPVRRVRSAGGVLARREGDAVSILLGRRRRAWRLPKGKLEPGERDEQAAIREIGEETGRRSRILAKLGSHRFRFSEDGVTVDKTAVHFLLVDEGPLRDPDGEFEELAWFPIAAARRKLRFPAERDTVRRAATLLAENPGILPAVPPPAVPSHLGRLLRRLMGR